MGRSRVLIVGAGMSGLVAARLLADAHEVVVVDKGRGVGGRLATRRIDDATFDHGAQFMTTHSEWFAAFIGELADAGVVTEWFRGRIGPDGVGGRDGHIRHRGSLSMNAVAKRLALDLDVRTGTLVTSIALDDMKWSVRFEDGSSHVFDAVVLTSPVPQSLALLDAGDVELAPADRAALDRIEYDPCLALMAVLDGPSGLPDPGAIAPTSGAIDWLADNQIKGISALPSVTIHASADFSRRHFDDDVAAIVAALQDAAALPAKFVEGEVQVHRWRYAKPSVEHPQRVLVAADLPPLVFGGDAFGGAKVEGAALSGFAISEALASLDRSSDQ